jgi:pyruvate formate lyase activating enzyme
MQFGGIQKTSLIDFPDRPSTVLFTPGCNLRCPFCHNWRLVLNPKGPFLPEEAAIQTLISRKKYIDSVVVTGGEPTIHTDLPRFLRQLKNEGFFVKIDTNGFFPQMLKKCLPSVDFVALDIKTTLDKYKLLGAKGVHNYLRTVSMLKRENLPYEFRTTVVPGFVDEDDIPKIGEVVNGAKRFAFQQFVPGDTLDTTFKHVKPYPKETVVHFAEIMKKYVDKTILRV